MGRVANAQQARTVPLSQSIDPDRQQLDHVPGCDLVYAIGEKWHDVDNRLAECLEPGASQLVVATFRNDIGALPVVTTIEHDEDVAVADVAKRRDGGVG